MGSLANATQTVQTQTSSAAAGVVCDFPFVLYFGYYINDILANNMIHTHKTRPCSSISACPGAPFRNPRGRRCPYRFHLWNTRGRRRPSRFHFWTSHGGGRPILRPKRNYSGLPCRRYVHLWNINGRSTSGDVQKRNLCRMVHPHVFHEWTRNGIQIYPDSRNQIIL